MRFRRNMSSRETRYFNPWFDWIDKKNSFYFALLDERKGTFWASSVGLFPASSFVRSSSGEKRRTCQKIGAVIQSVVRERLRRKHVQILLTFKNVENEDFVVVDFKHGQRFNERRSKVRKSGKRIKMFRSFISRMHRIFVWKGKSVFTLSRPVIDFLFVKIRR